MDIKNMIKNDIQSIEMQLGLDFNIKELRPMMFIDNTTFDVTTNKNSGIAHIGLFGACDVVGLSDIQLENEIFSTTNFFGENAVYCLWGMDSMSTIKEYLIECGYVITNKTTFFDLRQAAKTFYGRDIDVFEDVRDLISFATNDINEIFSTNESIMYSLFIDMLGRGFESELISDTIENLIVENELTVADAMYKGANFRKAESSINLDISELRMLQSFANDMLKYHESMSEFVASKLKKNSIAGLKAQILEEKLSLYEYKTQVYNNFNEMMDSCDLSESSRYDIFFSSLDLNAILEDAFSMLQEIGDEESIYASFVRELGGTLQMSTTSMAQTFMLRKNILASMK